MWLLRWRRPFCGRTSRRPRPKLRRLLPLRPRLRLKLGKRRRLKRRLKLKRRKLLTLRRQVIHNDMHPGNILLGSAGEISGIIDLGDAIKAPLIQDLAVSATSLVEAAPHAAADPLQDLIDGFCSACPLTAEDLGLLHDAMIMRSILSVVLGRVNQTVPPKDRPRAATAASETGLRAILALRLPAPQSGHSGGCANE